MNDTSMTQTGYCIATLDYGYCVMKWSPSGALL
jgi:hypothetical protein